jgi:hypothetical protein
MVGDGATGPRWSPRFHLRPELSLDDCPYWFTSLCHILQYRIVHVLLKDPELAMSEQIFFQRFQLEGGGAVRQSGLGRDPASRRNYD